MAMDAVCLTLASPLVHVRHGSCRFCATEPVAFEIFVCLRSTLDRFRLNLAVPCASVVHKSVTIFHVPGSSILEGLVQVLTT